MTDTLEDLVATLRAISETGPESAAPHSITAACAAAADRIHDQEEDYNLLLNRAAEIRAERDEARAERDLLHDVLEEVHSDYESDILRPAGVKGVPEEKTYPNCIICEALREVERGDTVDTDEEAPAGFTEHFGPPPAPEGADHDIEPAPGSSGMTTVGTGTDDDREEDNER